MRDCIRSGSLQCDGRLSASCRIPSVQLQLPSVCHHCHRAGQSIKVCARIADISTNLKFLPAAGGQPYYYHAATNQSTYVRPLPVPGSVTTIPQNAIIPGAVPKKKKEKPLVKTPIPDTPWLRVKTTEGNIFYTHREKKESVWQVPEEIKEQVEQLERNENEKEEREATEKLQREEEEKRQAEEEERRKEREEIERVKQEVQRDVSSGKRKALDTADEAKLANKKKRVTAETPKGADDKQGSEEDWQRNISEETTLEADQDETPELDPALGESKMVKAAFTVPDRVDLSLDEAKALFKVRE